MKLHRLVFDLKLKCLASKIKTQNSVKTVENAIELESLS